LNVLKFLQVYKKLDIFAIGLTSTFETLYSLLYLN